MKNSNAINERYSRQVLLKEFGEEGQRKLSQASVMVVGAGGLGCPALQYLAAAGVGRLGLIDDDTVALHNLHRQVLYTTEDVGLRKAAVAAKRLRQMNPDIEIEEHSFRLTSKNALPLFSSYDIILDATDNFATRYLINDACVLLKKSLVYGAISQFEGQVAVFNVAEAKGPAINYRDLFPQPPPAGSVLSCAEAGVLGVLPGIIGTMQATEVIKLITGMGKPLINRLLTYNALTHDSFVFALSARKETAALSPKDAVAFETMNYEWLCGMKNTVEEIDGDTFLELLNTGKATVIDVREEGEQPAADEFSHLKIPLSGLKEKAVQIETETAVLFCQSGKRSREAAKILTERYGSSKKIYSLKGGILQLKQQHGKEA